MIFCPILVFTWVSSFLVDYVKLVLLKNTKSIYVYNKYIYARHWKYQLYVRLAVGATVPESKLKLTFDRPAILTKGVLVPFNTAVVASPAFHNGNGATPAGHDVPYVNVNRICAPRVPVPATSVTRKAASVPVTDILAPVPAPVPTTAVGAAGPTNTG